MAKVVFIGARYFPEKGLYITYIAATLTESRYNNYFTTNVIKSVILSAIMLK